MHRSFWLEQALASAPDDPNPLRGVVSCDIAIVVAIRGQDSLDDQAPRPGVDVCLVEADVCGGGASGRNGGFVMTWWPIR